MQQPRRGLDDPRRLGTGSRVETDRAGDEASEPGQPVVAEVRRELPAGAAAAGGDQDGVGEGQARERRTHASSAHRTRSPRTTGSLGAAAHRPGHPVLADHRERAAVAQPGGAGLGQLDGGLAPGAVVLGGGRHGVQGVVTAGGVHDLRAGAAQGVGDHVGDPAALADRAVGGDDGDGAGRAAGLEGREQVRLVAAGDEQGDRAAALAEPLGEGEQRRGGDVLADQQARDRLLRERERPAQRTGQLDLRTDRQAGQPGAAGPDQAPRPACSAGP